MNTTVSALTVGGKLIVDSNGNLVAATVNSTNKSGDYSAVAGDVILADTTSAGFTVTLPLAADNASRLITVKKVSTDSNQLTVTHSGSDTIDGASSQIIVEPYTAVTFISDGTSWWII